MLVKSFEVSHKGFLPRVEDKRAVANFKNCFFPTRSNVEKMDFLPIIVLVLCWICSCPVAVDITDVDDYDPGTCDKSNALQVYSVKDRNDEKKLWICSNENGNYLWKPVDGDVDRGEFLNPGYDCSDILNHGIDSPDGFYWITLDVTKKRRVWCDMKTDGGGYMLVARKHDAITWDIPSKDETVDPKSTEKYWTSQLGDARIFDFRIQLSTSNSFNDTKAHWSFRLKNKRPLEQLMITDRGCSVLEPGIGDIAYVKDLLTETIASTTFECSVFGGLQSSGQLGWSMMNECLKNPCSGSGYFHHQGVAIAALDHTGVFSYSASGRTSGLNNDATAFIGCVNKKCCGCYGPVGKKGNYCNSQCSAANGGTIIDPKNVYTWVWARSRLPKQIWHRCMEYQNQDDKGQLQWYILVGDSTIPKRGRCSGSGKLRLNSGVVVVPDNATARKVPRIPGLLEYRQDQKKLYLRANKTWNLLTQEKEVKGKLTELDEGLSKLREKLAFILPQFDEYEEIIKVIKTYPECTTYSWLNESNRNNNNYQTESQYCDNSLITGWYRFGGGAGVRISTSCPNEYHCSTEYVGHMSENHPELHEGIVHRSVCFRSNGNCCYWGDTIQVLNCGLYYVYKLHAQKNCNRRYCGSF